MLAVGGAVSMVLGAVMLIDSPLPEMRIHWSTAIGLTLPFAAITVFLLSIALRARRKKVETGAEGMIGEDGRGRHRTCARRQSFRARRILGRRFAAARRRRRARQSHGHR